MGLVKKLFHTMILGCCISLTALEVDDRTVIVTSATERKAAAELQDYLRKITGLELNITENRKPGEPAIIVGNTLTGDFKEDEIFIDTPDATTLVLTGAAPRGTLYAVYTLLEDYCGVRFLAPEFEIVPKQEKLKFNDLHIRYAPQNIYRQPSGSCGSSPDWFPFMVKNKLNGSMFRKHKLPDEWGGFYYMDMNHSMNARKKGLLPKDKYFEEHQEYYAWDPKTKAHKVTQFCLSNPEVRRVVVENAMQIIEADKTKTYFSIGADDNAGICRCENCNKLYEQYKNFGVGYWLTANELAEKLREKGDPTRVIVQCYGVTMYPVKGLKIPPNVWVAYCRLGRNYGKPVQDGDDFAEFARQAGGRIFVWDYYANFSHYMLPLPLGAIAPSMKQYARLGSNGSFIQLPTGNLGDFSAYRIWLCAQLLWNPERDERQLFDTFFDGYYGAGASYVKAYAELREKAFARQPNNWLSCYGRGVASWFEGNDIAESLELIGKAQSAVEGQPVFIRHIEEVKAGILWPAILHHDQLPRKTGIPGRNQLVDELSRIVESNESSSAGERGPSLKNMLAYCRRPATLPGSLFNAPGAVRLQGTATLETKSFAECASSFWGEPPEALCYAFNEYTAGKSTLSITLRITAEETAGEYAAQLMIFDRHGEVARILLPPSKDWTTIKIGTYNLPIGSKVLLYPYRLGDRVKLEIENLILED